MKNKQHNNFGASANNKVINEKKEKFKKTIHQVSTHVVHNPKSNRNQGGLYGSKSNEAGRYGSRERSMQVPGQSQSSNVLLTQNLLLQAQASGELPGVGGA